MSARAKSIQLFLFNGTVKGAIKFSLSNWNGVIYKIPREELDSYKKREDFQHSGIYFLIGKDDEKNENLIYVGQAGVRKNGNGIYGRIIEHARNPEKDYWSEVVIITTSNNTFGLTEISYLENKFTQLAINAKNFIVKNSNDPNRGNITEEKECELEEFVDYTKLVMDILGHKAFSPNVKVKTNKKRTTNSSINEQSNLSQTVKEKELTKRETQAVVNEDSIQNKASKTNFVVRFPNGKIIQDKKAAVVFAKTIEELGPENVAKLNETICGEPLVTKNKNDYVKYPAESFEISNGWFVGTHSSTNGKIKKIEVLAQALNVKLEIKIV